MPLWRIYAHQDTFTFEQRKGISEAITKQYSILPAFYVNVIFVDVDEKAVFIGGEPKKNFVRITVEHIARTMDSPERRKGFMDRTNQTLKPFILDRSELEWEIHISETPRDLWRIQGLDPPPAESEAEKSWQVNNAPAPYKL